MWWVLWFWFGFHATLIKLGNVDCSVKVSSSVIQPSAITLSLFLDSELSMKQHVTKVVVMCFYYLWLSHLCQICHQVRLQSSWFWQLWYREMKIVPHCWQVFRWARLSHCNMSRMPLHLWFSNSVQGNITLSLLQVNCYQCPGSCAVLCTQFYWQCVDISASQSLPWVRSASSTDNRLWVKFDQHSVPHVHHGTNCLDTSMQNLDFTVPNIT